MSYHHYIDCPQCGACVAHYQVGCGSFDDMSPEELERVEKEDKEVKEFMSKQTYTCEYCESEQKFINGRLVLLKGIDNTKKLRKKQMREWHERVFISTEIDRIFNLYLPMTNKISDLDALKVNQKVNVLKFSLNLVDFMSECLHNKKKWNADMKTYWKKLHGEWSKNDEQKIKRKTSRL